MHDVGTLAVYEPYHAPKRAEIGHRRYLAVHRQVYASHTLAASYAFHTSGIGGHTHHLKTILGEVAELALDKGVKADVVCHHTQELRFYVSHATVCICGRMHRPSCLCQI